MRGSTASHRTSLRPLRYAGWGSFHIRHNRSAVIFAVSCAMSMDSELQKHYALLLGIGSPWEVKRGVEAWRKAGGDRTGLAMGSRGQMPGMRSGMFGSRLCAPERTWRHQHDAICHVDPSPDTSCGLSRARGQDDAGSPGRHRRDGSLCSSNLASDVLLASASISPTCELLGIGWEAAHEIMRRAVERGLERRQLEGLEVSGNGRKELSAWTFLHHVVNPIWRSRGCWT